MMPLALGLLLAAWFGGGTVTGRARLGAAAGLPDVVVAVRSGLPERAKYQAPRAPVVLSLSGCRFTPRVAGVMPGQPLELRNADPTPHRVTAVAERNRSFAVVVAPGGATRRYLATPEIAVRLACDGRAAGAVVAVLPHPFFAVTAADGTYALRGLPAGTYEIAAWHERYGARTATVRLTDSKPVSQDFRFAAP